MPYIADLGSYLYPDRSEKVQEAMQMSTMKKSTGLDMQDFLSLMVAQFQNQTMDNTADTTEMLNQLVQMQMVQALTNMTDASLMGYAASLVGKEVTISTLNSSNQPTEIVGTVTATGTYNNEQVVFVNGEHYYMKEIMAVGRLPEYDSGKNTTQKVENTTAAATNPTTTAPVANPTGTAAAATNPTNNDVPQTNASSNSTGSGAEESKSDAAVAGIESTPKG